MKRTSFKRDRRRRRGEEEEGEGEDEEREREEGRRRRGGIREKKNKYRGGTSDATTSWLFIVSLNMSFDDFLPSKIDIFVVRK